MDEDLVGKSGGESRVSGAAWLQRPDAAVRRVVTGPTRGVLPFCARPARDREIGGVA